MNCIKNILRLSEPAQFVNVLGKSKHIGVKVKTVRLKKYGKKRILIVHEKQDLSDAPRFLVTDALHWFGVRILTVWDYRWSSELFHEFESLRCGFESGKDRKEEAVKRHFRLSCVAQTILQNLTSPVSTSEKFKGATGQMTQGLCYRRVVREVFQGILAVAQQAFAEGKTHGEVLDMLVPI